MTVNTLQNLDHTGDSVTEWDPTKPAEVAAAKAVFDALKAKKYLAYTVTNGGARGEVIREFDPSAGKIMMAPQNVGG